MSDFEIVAGATSQRIGVWLADSSSTTGAGLTGLAFNTAGLTCYYWREDEGNAGATAVTLATATRGTFTSSGFVEKDATNMPGAYEFGIPNAAIASGAKWVKVMFKGATNLAQRIFTIRLLAVNLDDSVRAGLTALPNATAGANTGLPVVGTQVPNATAGASNGLHINGSNSGTTTYAALTVTGSLTVSDGLLVSRSTGNSSAIVATGNGTGHGIAATSGSGATGDGINAVAASTNGNGMTLTKTGTGTALNAATSSVVLASTNFGAGAIDAAALATDASQEIADTTWGRDMSAIARPGGGVRYPLQAMDVLRNKVDTSVSPAVIYQDDDVTTSFTTTLTTDPAAEQVVTSDPT